MLIDLIKDYPGMTYLCVMGALMFYTFILEPYAIRPYIRKKKQEEEFVNMTGREE